MLRQQQRSKKDHVMYAIRVPPKWKTRATKEATRRGVSMTDLVLDAVELELDLAEQLRPKLERIRVAGAAMGLDPATDEAAILSRLIELGLGVAL